jgi:hypothetical protein
MDKYFSILIIQAIASQQIMLPESFNFNEIQLNLFHQKLFTISIENIWFVENWRHEIEIYLGIRT